MHNQVIAGDPLVSQIVDEMDRIKQKTLNLLHNLGIAKSEILSSLSDTYQLLPAEAKHYLKIFSTTNRKGAIGFC